MSVEKSTSMEDQTELKPVWDIAGVIPSDIANYESLSKSQLKKEMRSLARRKLAREKRHAAKKQLQKQTSLSTCHTDVSGDNMTTNSTVDRDTVLKRTTMDNTGTEVTTVVNVSSESTEQKRKRRKHERMRDAEAFEKKADDGGFHVIVDCGFDSFMNPREQRSLCQQLQLSYAANRRADRPCKLTFVDVSDWMVEEMNKRNFKAWRAFQYTNQSLERYIQTLSEQEQKKLIYLTSDAPNDTEHIIQEIEQSGIYIIGGIIDRNRHKNLTLRKAESLGLHVARLPIDQHISMSGCRTLTTVHVLSIMLEKYKDKTWEEAFLEYLPTRKATNNTRDIETKKADTHEE